jgi:mono/diheme cytochrome c family protein
MRRTALALVMLVLAAAFVVVGCGGEEEASPTPDTVTGTTTETETTETETETTETGGGEGDAAAGKEVFLGSSGCGTCHTLADAGTTGTVGPNLDDSQPSFDLVVDRVTNGQGGMPSFSATLSEEDIQNVAAYITSAAGG